MMSQARLDLTAWCWVGTTAVSCTLHVANSQHGSRGDSWRVGWKQAKHRHSSEWRRVGSQGAQDAWATQVQGLSSKHSWCSMGRCRCHPPPLCTPSALPGAPVTGTALRSACIERLRVCIGVTLHLCRAQCVRITCRQQEAFDGALLDSYALATLLSFFTDDISCPTRPRHATNRQAHRGREPIFATA
jgi:hypothetical protein